MGIQPDVLVCRSEHPLDDAIKEKIALFCNVENQAVIQNLDVESLYALPLALEEEQLAQVVCKCLELPCPEPQLAEWQAMVSVLRQPEREITIALVGKYVQLHDAYLSVAEALRHGGIPIRASVTVRWIDSETVTGENAGELLKDADGILVPGGFGTRGIEGMLKAVRYARENHIPFLGICLGMQLAIVEYARNVLHITDAESSEWNENAQNPVIDLLPDQENIENLGGTLRLGAYPCILNQTSRSYGLYGRECISERHRHRYEVNNRYRRQLEAAGMVMAGTSPDQRIVEMVELAGHPFFVATQAHPEFKSRPNRPHPLFAGFAEAAWRYKTRS